MRLKQKRTVRSLKKTMSSESRVDLNGLVLVTGAGGFIGSHVVEALLERGAPVRALVHYNGSGRQGHLETINPRFRRRLEIVSGDIRDSHQMDGLVRGCSTVAHLAALIAIPYSYQAAGSYVTTRRRVRPVKSEVDLLLCDPSKARQRLGWEPHIDLEEGIARTAAYIKGHLGTYRPGEYAQ